MSDNIRVEDLSEAQARATVDFIVSIGGRVLAIHWFVVGILVGVCGNIASSGLIELIKLWVPTNWPWIILGLTVITGVILIYYTRSWYQEYKELMTRYYETLDKFRPFEGLTRKAYPESFKSERQDHQNYDRE